MSDQSNLPAMLADLGDLEDGRNRAIGHWLATYDAFHAGSAAAAAASIGGKIGLSFGGGSHSQCKLSEAFGAFGEAEEWQGHQRVKLDARERFSAKITATVDRRCWEHLMVQLGFDQLLDRQAAQEFRESLIGTPPEFTRANCQATFSSLWGNRREMYLRGIANVFMAMDRRFRSHDAFAIGNRLIIERALNEWGSWNAYDRRDTLYDVERIFRELDGLGPHPRDGGIISAILDSKCEDTPRVIEGDYFRVRVFGNGNLHLWFQRKDLLKQINVLLLEYYKPVEGDVGEGPSYESEPLFHQTPAKYFGAFNTSAEVAQIVIDKAEIYGEGMTVLEPSAGTGMLAKAARDKGARVTCIELQPGLAHELGAVHGFRSVYERDFLKCEPATFGTYDRIVMNPPFDRGRDCDHVRHAFKFLKPGGRLVAIMSARAEHCQDERHKALHKLVTLCRPGRESWAWRDLPERSFAHAGTNVNTVILTLENPRA
jgi:predicted RNA methylase